jgi:hypothetical protein
MKMLKVVCWLILFCLIASNALAAKPRPRPKKPKGVNLTGTWVGMDELGIGVMIRVPSYAGKQFNAEIGFDFGDGDVYRFDGAGEVTNAKKGRFEIFVPAGNGGILIVGQVSGNMMIGAIAIGTDDDGSGTLEEDEILVSSFQAWR